MGSGGSHFLLLFRATLRSSASWEKLTETMAAKRIAQSAINWGAIAEKVGESQRPMFNSFKSKSDAYLRKVLANPEAPPAIDWAFYKQKIAAPVLVDSFQKHYEALKVPYPANKVSPLIDAQKAEAEQKIFCWNLGMIEKEQKGLKLISLSLVLGTLLDKKEHLWTKREQLFVQNY